MMDDWRERVIYERADLHVKLVKLLEFLGSEKIKTLEAADRQRLRTQAIAMVRYSDTLTRRIDAFFTTLSDAAHANDRSAN